jgi:hypothetical protein
VVKLRGLGSYIGHTVWFPGYFDLIPGINTPSQDSWVDGMLLMEEDRSHEAMMGRTMMFGKIDSEVVAFWVILEDIEVSLVAAVAHLVKAHLDGFRALLIDCPVDDAICGGIIGL